MKIGDTYQPKLFKNVECKFFMSNLNEHNVLVNYARNTNFFTFFSQVLNEFSVSSWWLILHCCIAYIITEIEHLQGFFLNLNVKKKMIHTQFKCSQYVEMGESKIDIYPKSFLK